MYGSLPPASVYATWVENIELWSVDDSTLADLSDVEEITVTLRDPSSMFDELTLKMSEGTVTIPSQGIIQWRAEVSSMRTLSRQLYDVLITLENDTDTVALYLGNISILE